MDALTALGQKYNTDKAPTAYAGDGHNYTPFYFEEFNEHRADVKRVFELGINAGASILMWRDYFNNADIYCADIHLPGVELMNSHLGIHAHYVDQHDAKSLMELRDWLPRGIDLMIDDGNHDPDDQILTANILADRLAVGGRYVIEDIVAGKDMYIIDHILWPWSYTSIQFDTKRKSDDRLIVIERVRG